MWTRVTEEGDLDERDKGDRVTYPVEFITVFPCVYSKEKRIRGVLGRIR